MRERLDVGDEQIMLALQKGSQRLGYLSRLTEINYNTLRQRVAKLQKYGYLAKSKYGEYALTGKGKSFVEELSAPVTPNLKDLNLKKVIGLLPTELHRAFFRLLISAIVGKHLLFEIYEVGYPAFIIGGSTKAFKTALAGVICRLFSLEHSKHVILVPSLAPGELWGRRFMVKGAKFDIGKSPHFQKPWLCFDEFDKVPSLDAKRGIFLFLDGRREFEVEGRIIVNHAIAMTTLNTRPKDGLGRLGIPDAYIRRSVVVDTDFVKSELGEVDLAAKEIFALKDFPIMNLKRLMLTRNKLEEEEFKLLRRLLMENTRDEFKGLVDTQPLEILALGRSALLNGDVREAIYQTLWDRLLCVESLGGAITGWRESVGKEWAKYKREEQPEIEEQLREAEEKRRRREKEIEERKREIEQRGLEQVESKYDLLYQRQKLIEEVKAQVQKLKAKHPELAKPLGILWRDVQTKVKTSEALERYKVIFERYLVEKVRPVLQQEEEQRKEREKNETQRQEQLLEVNSLIAKVNRIIKGFEKLEVDNQKSKELLNRLLERRERVKAREPFKFDASFFIPILISFEIDSLERELEKAQQETRERDKQTKLKLVELKEKLKVINYYLRRKRLNEKEDPVLILQQIGAIQISDYSYSKPVKGSWATGWPAGGRVYAPPNHAFVDVTGQIHDRLEVSDWTSWQAVGPLLRRAKVRTIEELRNLSRSTTPSQRHTTIKI